MQKTILLLKRALGILYIHSIDFLFFVNIKTFRKKIGFVHKWKLQWLPSLEDNAYVCIHKNQKWLQNVSIPLSDFVLEPTGVMWHLFIIWYDVSK